MVSYRCFAVIELNKCRTELAAYQMQIHEDNVIGNVPKSAAEKKASSHNAFKDGMRSTEYRKYCRRSRKG